MPSRIVFSDPSYNACFTPKQKSKDSVVITQFAPQIYGMQKSQWSEVTHEWMPISKEIVFRNPKQNNNLVQQRYSDRRTIAWAYLTGACIMTILTSWVSGFFLSQNITLRLRGITIPLTTHTVFKASTAAWAVTLPLIWCITKVLEIRNTPQHALTKLEQRLRFSKFKKDASAYAAVVSLITSSIGIYLYHAGRITLRGSVYRLTPNQAFILTAGSMIATFLTAISYDRQTQLCRDHAFDLAAQVLSASDDAVVPDPLIERKDYV
jgi:hypothetical protein